MELMELKILLATNIKLQNSFNIYLFALRTGYADFCQNPAEQVPWGIAKADGVHVPVTWHNLGKAL